VDSGFYAACAGLRAQSQALEVAANNLANLNTSGFRAQQTSFQSFMATANSGLLNPLSLAINNFGVLEGSQPDLTTGNLESTGNPLDLAIEGRGFFAVQTARGTRYTRNGNFRISPTRELVTASGDRVLGENGVIRIPEGSVSFGSDGVISVNGAMAGKLRLVDFGPGTRLSVEGQTLLVVPDGSAQPARQSTIRSGTLESSNVNAIAAVATLIGVQREAEMLQRAMSLFHGELNRVAAEDLPRI
jgi:flagellar basal-body rod protein FlgF/flagellar basal-body rod protein FlgG